MQIVSLEFSYNKNIPLINGGSKMKKILIVLALFVMCFNISNAQETRREVTNTTTKYDDSKPNSDSVPDVYDLDGKFDKIIIFRLKYKADLLAGLKKIVEDKKIKNAVILSGIGSVRGYQYHTVSNRTFPSKNIFVKNPTAPADITSMNGYIINGRVHCHISFTNPDKEFGGHLEPGTEVFTFAIVTVGVLSDNVDLTNIDNKNYR
jgi:predicted DNA-binding protein with PD1-like motif